MTGLNAFVLLAALTLAARCAALTARNPDMARFFDRVTVGLVFALMGGALWALMPLPSMAARVGPFVVLVAAIWATARLTDRFAHHHGYRT
jgi:hypothetical protein